MRMEAVKKAEPKQPLRRLGRGLSSLMALEMPVRVEVPAVSASIAPAVVAPEVSAPAVSPPPLAGPPLKGRGPEGTEFQSISLDAIVASPFQPRKVMDE